MLLALGLFALFALVATGGGFLIVRHFRGPRYATLFAALLLAFFLGLGWAVWRMVLSYGPTLP